jgi:hypothetical protein
VVVAALCRSGAGRDQETGKSAPDQALNHYAMPAKTR